MTAEKPLHVTIASTQELWHGGEKQAALLAEGLRRRGHTVSVLARRDGLFARGMRDRDFEVVALAGRGRSLPTLMHARQNFKRLQPDVIFANDGHALTSVAFSSLGLPIPLRVAARRVDFPIRSRAKFSRFANGVICVSNAVAEVCRQSGLEDSLLHVVHDGVPASFAASGQRARGRAALQLDESTPLLLVVSKLTDHKGHRYLLDAMPKLLDVHPNATLALAGDGELRDSLEQQVHGLGLARCVRFLGYRHDIPDLLAAADVVVQPSHLEGLCSSLIDAMLASRPIVATRAGGIPDLLDVPSTEEPVGWLVPPKSPDSLATAIAEVLTNKSAAESRSQAARKRALAHFTDDTMVERTLDVFAKILRRRHGQAA